jgi:hypothetical protein
MRKCGKIFSSSYHFYLSLVITSNEHVIIYLRGGPSNAVRAIAAFSGKILNSNLRRNQTSSDMHTETDTIHDAGDLNKRANFIANRLIIAPPSSMKYTDFDLFQYFLIAIAYRSSRASHTHTSSHVSWLKRRGLKQGRAFLEHPQPPPRLFPQRALLSRNEKVE